jgi:hypothetical protein
MKKLELRQLIKEELQLQEAKSKLVSFDKKLVVDRCKSILPLLGENNSTLNPHKTKFLDDVYNLLKKHSTLKAK